MTLHNVVLHDATYTPHRTAPCIHTYPYTQRHAAVWLAHCPPRGEPQRLIPKPGEATWLYARNVRGDPRTCSYLVPTLTLPVDGSLSVAMLHVR